MRITRLSHFHPLIALGMLVTACRPTTAPEVGVDFDSDGTLDAYEAMDGLLATRALAGFQALAGRTPFSVSPAAIEVVGALRHAAQPDGGRTFASALASWLQAGPTIGSGPSATPLISDMHRGVTFVYDPETDEYAPDPERADAPDQGVRFVLYEVDLSGRPIVEDEIGFADLVDEGDQSAEDVVLRLVVVARGTTVLEYRITLDVLEEGGALGVHGALQDPGGLRLDFDIEAQSVLRGNETTLDVAFDLRIDARDFSVTGTVSGIEDAVEGEGSVELTVRHRDDSIRLAVDGQGGEIDGSVFVNGSLFATVTGDAKEPMISSASGEPLTLGEFLVLRHILDGVEDVFDFLEDLLDPVDELVILAIIL